MQLFGRTGGYYLFWTGFVYLFVVLVNSLVYKFTESEYIQIAWFVVLALPLTVKPVARHFNMNLLWEK